MKLFVLRHKPDIQNLLLLVTVVYFSNIFHIFQTFSTLVISTFYAFSTVFSISFIMFISTHMANFLI